MSRVLVATYVVLLALSTLSCDSPAQHGTVTVYAASSLTDVFGELEREFEAAHGDVDVRMSFAGSQVLRLQIEQGGQADLFASANPVHVEALVDAGLLSHAAPFAQNELVVIVPQTNPAGLERLTDLPQAKRIVVGTENVPVGIYTREVIERAANEFGESFGARVRQNIVSEESNVRLVRTKVELGEADAAFVYRTDAIASDRVQMIPVPAAINAAVDYYLGSLSKPGEAEPVDRFVAFVGSDSGQSILRRHGFMPRSR